jgi:hypothetical protein
MSRSAWLVAGAAGLLVLAGGAVETFSQTPLSKELRPVASFASIPDTQTRSIALFAEAAKVLHHPRCVNCHPVGERPTQGDDKRPHRPLVVRGKKGQGAPGMACTTCHGKANYDPARVPGDGHWQLAPASMGWEGRTVGELCNQLKDPRQTGGRDLAAILKHLVTDTLVLWAWEPGPGRTPAPGTNQEFAALMKAWTDTGAHCPAP